MSFPRRLTVACAAGALVAAALVPVRGAHAGSRAPAAAQEDDLARDALAVLEASCFRCHGADPALRPKGGLRLATRASALTGGESGPALVPGDPAASELVRRVSSPDREVRMPPKSALLPEQVALLERWVAAGAPWPGEAVGADAFFEQRVLPVLQQNCFRCHGPDVEHPKSELRMSGTASLLTGGARGPALTPGSPRESLILRALRGEDDELAMPPDGPLPAEQIADIERWIELGAPWPGGESATSEEDSRFDLDEARDWWSFRPVRRPLVPDVERAELVANPIDAFVVSALELEGLAPNELAGERTLVRRAYVDVLGLPPTLEEVERYASDPRPDRWERLVDELLERPEYAVRQARVWLDLVRFGQSNGYERDHEKPFAWRYRDWVVQSFRDDLPYDRFLTEQLAGDELDEPTRDSIVATGFYRIGAWDAEPADPAEALFDEKDDVLRTIGEGFLGVTLGCARCHDHMYDPFRQEDYYSLLAFVDNVRPYEVPRFRMDAANLVALDALDDPRAAWVQWDRSRTEWLANKQAELEAMLAIGRERVLAERARRGDPTPEHGPTKTESILALTDPEQRRCVELRVEIDAVDDRFAGDVDWALAVREPSGAAPETRVLIRGRAATPGAVVEPGFPPALVRADADAHPELPERGADDASSGRRRALAAWIASAENPLTARVLVNRLWQMHFGVGIVSTPNDFGTRGTLPTHPDLLDWLASEFVESGWSVKQLHRLMLRSRTYRLASSTDNADAYALDPANELVWRQNPRRVEGEVLRDALLAVSGTLDPEEGGRGFFPRLSRETLEGASRPGNGWDLSPPDERDRRSLWAFAKRGVPVPIFETFDCPSPALPTGRRQVTTTATQALVLLNSGFANEKAAAFAERVLEAGPSADGRIARAFELALSRAPTSDELELARDYLADLTVALGRSEPSLAFRPRVPRRIDTYYLERVGGADLLYGPEAGWTFLAGEWGEPYNHTVQALPHREPAALLDAPRFDDGGVRARVRLSPGCERACLLLRADSTGASTGARGELATGIEVALDARAGLASVALLPDDGGEARTLAERAIELEPERWYELVIDLHGARLALALDGEPVLEVADLPHTAPGRFGARAVGDGFELADASLLLDGDAALPLHAAQLAPERLALESLCLTLFNANEFLWID